MKNICQTLLTPKSVAVVGASRSPEKVGYQILKNIIDSGYKGKIYPVNPNARSIMKLKVFPTLEHIGSPVDLAIIVTPALLVPTIINECIHTKAKASIVITAGFAESSAKGKALQETVGSLLGTSTHRVLGPNCLGVFSTLTPFNATFGPELPVKGKVALISQSGALVTGVLDWVNQKEIGLSHAITLGNRIDISEVEALEYLGNDKHTSVIMVYIESFKDAHQFFSIASRITSKKPVVLLKGGQSKAGQQASASHTAALASDYTLIKNLALQVGVTVTDTVDEWLNLTAAFSTTKKVDGNNIMIVTNAGGPGVLSSDIASNLDLDIVPIDSIGKHALKKIMSHVAPHNPLDLYGDAVPEHFYHSLRSIYLDKHQNAFLVIITPQTTTQPVKTAEKIIEASKNFNRPVFTVLIGGEKLEKAREILRQHHVPCFDFPTQAINIIAGLSHYNETKNSIKSFPANNKSIINKQVKNRLEQKLLMPLTLETAFDVLKAFHIALPKSMIIDSVTDVPEALAFAGRPAVFKTANMGLAHKAKYKGVFLNINTTHHGRLAFRQLEKLYSQVLVQQTIKGELELIIGARVDPQLGPFITVGLGGSYTNFLQDRAYIFIPGRRIELENAYKKTKAYAIAQSVNLPIEPVINLLENVGSIITTLGIVEEIEINPVIVTKNSAFAADIKIRVKNSTLPTILERKGVKRPAC